MATKLRWLGHSTVLVESEGHKILMDPFFTGNPAAVIKQEDAEADCILISHGHGDHVGDAVEIAKRTGATVIANFEIAGWLQKQGLDKVHPLQHGGGYDFDFGRVKMTIAFHGSQLPDGSEGGNPAGFILFLKDGLKIYNAADTALFSDMQLIGEHGIDLALLPIGDNFTMGPDDALRAVQFIEPKKVMPFHYNTWPLIAQDAEAWGNLVRQKTKTEPVIIKPGDSIDL